MENPRNEDARSALAVVDNVVPDGKAPQPLIDLVASCASFGRWSKEQESLGDGIDDTIGDLEVPEFLAT